MAKKKQKVFFRDKPPALRRVLIKAVAPADIQGHAAVIIHLSDARNDQPCDIAFSAAQLDKLVERLQTIQEVIRDASRQESGDPLPGPAAA